MFWKKTIQKIKDLSEVRYKMTHNRIDKISDYIQGPLSKVIEKAIDKYFKELEKNIKNKIEIKNKGKK